MLLRRAAALVLPLLLCGRVGGSPALGDASTDREVAELVGGEPPEGKTCLLQRDAARRTPPGHGAVLTESTGRHDAKEARDPTSTGAPAPQAKYPRTPSATAAATTSAPSRDEQSGRPSPAAVVDRNASGAPRSVRPAEAPAQVSAPGNASAPASQEKGGAKRRKKSKVTLMVIEMCPLCWILGIDRFYLGNVGLGIAKLGVCVSTCFVGGLVWGTIDFIVIMLNALERRRSIDSFGIAADFDPEEVDTALILAIVDLLVLPLGVALVRVVVYLKKQQRLEKQHQKAMYPTSRLMKGG